MADIQKVYSRQDIVIVLADTDPIQVLNSPGEFNQITVQADPDNDANIKTGGAGGALVLLPGAAQVFKNGITNSIYVSGTAGDIINVHIEY